MPKKIFEFKLNELANRVKLLGVDLRREDHPLITRLIEAKNLYDKDKSGACAHACYVQIVMEDLDKIQRHDLKLFQCFKREIRRNPLPPENYFGLRMEIRMAASLTDKKTSFTKSETPDFLINDVKNLGIECSSAHLSLHSSHDAKELFYKVEANIKKKEQSCFSTRNTILAIDISNLIFHEGKNAMFALLYDKDKARPRLTSIINRSVFQSIICFTFAWVNADNKPSFGATLHCLYHRADRLNIDPQVESFLNKHWPLGDLWVEANIKEI
ncbi:MAG TPA: hypothetical protein DIS66_01850 [Candidatus Omnitrophica bacterium]|nr:hypothetical protein [Candidatus Omnitrophota bacterium]